MYLKLAKITLFQAKSGSLDCDHAFDHPVFFRKNCNKRKQSIYTKLNHQQKIYLIWNLILSFLSCIACYF